MVLDEAQQALLVAGVRLQVPAHRLGGLVHEPVVEALVVAEVEALLLERPLHVPVGLGDEQRGPGCAALTRAISGGQYSSAGAAPARSPHVRAKTSLVISIAMSQRSPSHWPPMSMQRLGDRVAQRRARTR